MNMHHHQVMRTEHPAVRTAISFALRHPQVLTLCAWGLILLVALLPRVLDLGQFITDDEANFWLRRSELFLHAIQTGDYAATAISTHPGVTTMWLGSAGIVLRHTLRDLGIVTATPFPVLLALMRLPAALVHVAGILVGYGLLRRMLPARPALLAALFWAADPFLIGYSRLLHVDALMATFATLSILAACYYWQHHAHPATLILSAVCAALAVLSKSPALALLPVIVLLSVGVGGWGLRGGAWRAWCLVLGSWFVIFLITLLLVWPAIWASPMAVYEQLATGVEAEGTQPHMTGNFFLGREDPAPGPLFYPVAVALRLTPWTLLGLFLLPWAVRSSVIPHAARITDDASRRDLAVLAGFAVLFILAMSLFPKKFNRYLVPIFPSLDILAAIGWYWALEKMQWSMQHLPSSAPRTRFNVLGALAAACMRRGSSYITPVLAGLAILNAAWWHPYSLAAFNQAFGGAQVGARTFSVGWGEGFDQVAAWLNAQPDITGVLTSAIMITTLNPYLQPGAQADTPRTAALPAKTGYVIVYIYQTQGKVFPPFDQFYRRATPVHTVQIHGVNYAWIYQVPPPVATPRPATFGNGLTLRGYTIERGLQPGQDLVMKLFWHTQAAPPTDYWLFAHLIGADGQRYQQVDIPQPTSTWQANRYITTELVVPIPADLPAGRHQLIIGLYDRATEQRLPLQTAYPANPAFAGPDALLLTESP